MSGQGPPGPRENNFDFLRFAAASMVIVSHSCVLTGSVFEPLAWITRGFDTFGGLGVAIFFVMSGYLIAESWSREPRLERFFKKRLLRILPAFAAAVLLACFLVGPIATTLDLRSYLSSATTWDYLGNLLLLRIRYFLPGVFEGNPVPRAVNGSLWTIPIEVLCYVSLAALGAAGLLSRRILLIGILAALLVFEFVALPAWGGRGIPLLGATAARSARLVFYFFAGALLRRSGAKRLSPGLGIAAAAALVAFLFTPFASAAARLTLPVIVLSAAFAPMPLLQRFGRFGDFSYGMYVYAFPIQQWLVEGVPAARAPLGLFLLGFPAIVVVAAASWHLLEAPALRHKGPSLRDRVVECPP